MTDDQNTSTEHTSTEEPVTELAIGLAPDELQFDKNGQYIEVIDEEWGLGDASSEVTDGE